MTDSKAANLYPVHCIYLNALNTQTITLQNFTVTRLNMGQSHLTMTDIYTHTTTFVHLLVIQNKSPYLLTLGIRRPNEIQKWGKHSFLKDYAKNKTC